MKSVNVAHLKSHLSACLQLVRGGGELLVCDRNTPIAKIVPLPSATDGEAELRALAAVGTVKLPELPPLRPTALERIPATRRVRRNSAKLLEEERHDRI
jgi:antitoxin (DNA-binding transcriptional repressor) of toxin-antitoxin stability system